MHERLLALLHCREPVVRDHGVVRQIGARGKHARLAERQRAAGRAWDAAVEGDEGLRGVAVGSIGPVGLRTRTVG